jgi:hypothetical protein
VGSKVQSAIFGAPKVNPPSGTTGTKALPDVNVTSGGKGLLRAQTANTGKGLLEGKWGKPSNSPGFLSSLFANFIPQNQSGIKYRSDEGAYGLMLQDSKDKLTWIEKDGYKMLPFQKWIGGGEGKGTIRPNGEVPSGRTLMFGDTPPAGGITKGDVSNGVTRILTQNKFAPKSVEGIGSVGFNLNKSIDANSPGVKYGDNVGADSVTRKSNGDYEASEIMVEYGAYVDPKKAYPTSRGRVGDIDALNAELLKVLSKDNILNMNDPNSNPFSPVYIAKVPVESRVVGSGLSPDNGYTRIFNAKEKTDKRSGYNYKLGVLREYRESGTKLVSDDIVATKRNSLRLPTSNNFDAINTLTVLDGKTQMGKTLEGIRGWENMQWQPYVNDLVALYFYDVVNDKYIPFRAAIKGLSESANASWEEMPFIGRGDKVYSYGGFNRNLSVTINIVISSLLELAPTWQRINYLTTLVKPANYTTSKYNGAMNRFMVPPMVMLTLGDMYKDQPVLIQSAVTTIPDDAIWETQHQINGEQWKYLADYMSAPSNVLFGQLPRTIDITLGLILLEKERAVVGGANFGHAPRDEELRRWNTDTTPEGGSPTKLHGSWVVDNIYGQKKIYSPSEFEQSGKEFQ